MNAQCKRLARTRTYIDPTLCIQEMTNKLNKGEGDGGGGGGSY